MFFMVNETQVCGGGGGGCRWLEQGKSRWAQIAELIVDMWADQVAALPFSSVVVLVGQT